MRNQEELEIVLTDAIFHLTALLGEVIGNLNMKHYYDYLNTDISNSICQILKLQDILRDELKKGGRMKICPLRMAKNVTEDLNKEHLRRIKGNLINICVEEYCAWWSEDKKMCSINNIITGGK